ncbi:MAG: flagellin, partial [Fibrobacter sp.]|nr:flagellin [Fibrobacter sp.]
TMRSNMGAFINRLEHAINNLTISNTNQQSAESLIRDADFARESSQFTRNQILAQSGTSMLAQANQVPQSILSLLR